jgi:hypothetical protein
MFKPVVGPQLSFIFPFLAFQCHFIFLQRSQEGLDFCFFVFLQGNQGFLVLFQRDVVLFEEVFGLLFIVLIDGHYLLTLLGGIVGEFAAASMGEATPALAEATPTEAALTLTEATPTLTDAVLTEAALSPLSLSGMVVGPALLVAGSAMKVAGSAGGAGASTRTAMVKAVSFGQAVTAHAAAPAMVHHMMMGSIGVVVSAGGLSTGCPA